LKTWRSVPYALLALAIGGCGADVGDGPGGTDTQVTSPTPTGSGVTRAPTPAEEESSQLAKQTREFVLDGFTAVAPADWTVVEPANLDVPGLGLIGPGSILSIDPAEWPLEWGIPGVFIMVTTDLAAEIGTSQGGSAGLISLAEWHGSLERDDCERSGASVYHSRDGQLSGFTTFWPNCGGIGVTLLDMAGIPESGQFVVIAQATGGTDGKVEVVDEVLRSIVVTG